MLMNKRTRRMFSFFWCRKEHLKHFKMWMKEKSLKALIIILTILLFPSINIKAKDKQYYINQKHRFDHYFNAHKYRRYRWNHRYKGYHYKEDRRKRHHRKPEMGVYIQKEEEKEEEE